MSFGILIPISLILGLIGLGAFSWALRNGQFDDPDGAAWRVMPTDNPPEPEGTHDDNLAPHTPDRHA